MRHVVAGDGDGDDAPESSPRVRRGRRVAVIAAVVVVMAASAGAIAVVALRDRESGGGGRRAVPPETPPDSTAAAAAAPYEGWVDPASAGRPYYGATIPGLLTFRGNPTRTYSGQGPMPGAPRPVWRYPGAAMCSVSEDRGEVSNWCGTGWTGEPAVFERDGRTWLVFGAYDRAVHFVDAATGEDILPPFPTGDLIKGSVTIDPHGFPLVYVGSRDGFFRVLAFDRPQATELWRLSANDVSPTKWNDDWDGSSLVLGDYLFEGGENSQMHVVKLNRGRAPDGHGHGRAVPRVERAGLGRRASRRGRQRGLDRELGRDLGRHALLRQLRRARAGLGHLRVAHRDGAAATRVPVLDR